jgi:hypothetical protein
MKLPKGLKKLLKPNNLLVILGVVLLLWAVNQYSQGKGLSLERMGNSNFTSHPAAVAQQQVQPVANGNGNDNGNGNLPHQGQTNSANELMPQNTNGAFLGENPSAGLDKTSFLEAGHLLGINTVGTCNKNGPVGANMLRGEPPITQGAPPPMNVSTIEGCNLNKGISN